MRLETDRGGRGLHAHRLKDFLRHGHSRLSALVAITAIAIAAMLGGTATRAAETAEVPGPAASACPEGQGVESAMRIQARYDGIRDLAAGFTQESQSATFAGEPLMDGATKTGQVVFAKPGKMRWVYEAPDASVVVSDGSTLWIYDVAGGTATRLEVTAGYLSGAALQFLLGDGRILDSFAVEAIACAEGRVTLDLLPNEDATYERLGLVADEATGDIVETSVVDLFGNRTIIRFQDMRVNQKPSADTFTFEAPEGVEVIDYEAAPS